MFFWIKTFHCRLLNSFQILYRNSHASLVCLFPVRFLFLEYRRSLVDNKTGKLYSAYKSSNEDFETPDRYQSFALIVINHQTIIRHIFLIFYADLEVRHNEGECALLNKEVKTIALKHSIGNFAVPQDGRMWSVFSTCLKPYFTYLLVSLSCFSIRGVFEKHISRSLLKLSPLKVAI